MFYSTRFNSLYPLLFLIYVSSMSQVLESDLYLYADSSCLLFQHKEATEIKKKQTVNQRPVGLIGL